MVDKRTFKLLLFGPEQTRFSPTMDSPSTAQEDIHTYSSWKNDQVLKLATTLPKGPVNKLPSEWLHCYGKPPISRCVSSEIEFPLPWFDSQWGSPFASAVFDTQLSISHGSKPFPILKSRSFGWLNQRALKFKATMFSWNKPPVWCDWSIHPWSQSSLTFHKHRWLRRDTRWCRDGRWRDRGRRRHGRSGGHGGQGGVCSRVLGWKSHQNLGKFMEHGDNCSGIWWIYPETRGTWWKLMEIDGNWSTKCNNSVGILAESCECESQFTGEIETDDTRENWRYQQGDAIQKGCSAMKMSCCFAGQRLDPIQLSMIVAYIQNTSGFLSLFSPKHFFYMKWQVG